MKSMTGYGCAAGTSGKIEISIELKSVNNRFLDCSFRMPRVYASFEEKMRATVQKYVTRGKLDVYVTVDATNADNVEITVNRSLAASYVKAIRELAETYGLADDLTALSLARFQDVLKAENVEQDEDTLCADMCSVLTDALADFNAMREREGEKLCADMNLRLREIIHLTDIVEERSPQTVAEYRAKLEARMAEVLQGTNIDEARILTEAAIFADRVAVNEEVVRLRSHVSQLGELLKSKDPVGRKLDFLIQELNREANTIGSKCNDAELARVVVDLKAEIEKLREQVQNVE